MDYSTIYDFCKVRNTGTVFSNSPDEPTPRVKFLMDLLDKEGIEFDCAPGNIKKDELSFIWHNPHKFINKTFI